MPHESGIVNGCLGMVNLTQKKIRQSLQSIYTFLSLGQNDRHSFRIPIRVCVFDSPEVTNFDVAHSDVLLILAVVARRSSEIQEAITQIGAKVIFIIHLSVLVFFFDVLNEPSFLLVAHVERHQLCSYLLLAHCSIFIKNLARRNSCTEQFTSQQIAVILAEIAFQTRHITGTTHKQNFQISLYSSMDTRFGRLYIF